MNPRDRALYPVLLSLATGNISCFGLLSHPDSPDDPYWLYLVHAVQLAREIGIDRPATIAENVRNTAPNAPDDSRERLFRNYERTWLATFIADKSFGIITGRSHCLEALEKRRDMELTSVSILNWHLEAYGMLTQTRNARCTPDDLPSLEYLPILAFYMNHNLLVLNAQALRDITAVNEPTTSTATLTISRRTLEVATRTLDLVLTDQTMSELLLGFQNNQYIMICHAATEILRAIQRGGLTAAEVSEAAAKVLAVPSRLERVAKLLPAKSAAHLYLDLSRFLACQVEVVTTRSDLNDAQGAVDRGNSSDEWWGTDDAGCPDFGVWLDMGYGYIGSEQLNLASNECPDTRSSYAGDLIFS
ncbi:hypothetical protein LA080_002850 [Diaporthe eres]|nr:hypothetical protein LA080_002850 [Diaporthe eres]